MPGAPDPRYLLARRILLDALEAIGEQRNAIVLVGAHAIYLHVGEEADLAVAPFTMDGDLAVVPTKLAPAPKLGEALKKAGFQQTAEVGIWKKDALIGDEPANKCNGVINRTRTGQHNGGGSGQLTRHDSSGQRTNQFTVGGAYDRSRVGFVQ